MILKAVLFDLDGTILDTIDELAITMNEVRRMLELPPQDVDKVRSMVGNGIRNLIKRSLAGESGRIDEAHTLFMDYYNANCIQNTTPYDGIPELLMRVKQAGIRTAVISNKADRATCILVNHFFPGMFDCIRGHRENMPLKPAPDVVRQVITELGVSVDECIYVGDSEVDIMTAQNCGMECISVDWGFKTRSFLVDNGAKRILSTPGELEEFILRRRGIVIE